MPRLLVDGTVNGAAMEKWITDNWSTIGPLFGAAIGSAGTALGWLWAEIIRAKTLRRQQDQHEWQRIQELIKIVGNEQGTIGTWEQIAALRELRALKNKREIVKPIVAQMLPLYEQRNASKELLAEFREFLRDG